jgi:riboflavin biosynthesis pyrimidine reductase
MESSLDGSLHPSKWTESPDGGKNERSSVYEKAHEELQGDAWLVGRITMAEMAKGTAHPPAKFDNVPREAYFAKRDASGYAIGVDPKGKLHFLKSDIGGDHVVVLLSADVPDSHLAELKNDGISYIVSQGSEINLQAALIKLNAELGIKRLLLEGGAGINGSFFAAGLVDELYVLIAPAFDGRDDQAIVFFEGGLQGKTKLSLRDATVKAHGMVQLRYHVSS